MGLTSALRLLAKTVAFQVPPKILVFGLLNKVNYWKRTGNRRFEFERLYLENPDPWDYHSSSYERQKYERVLACTLNLRSASKSALEVGCSVGVFSKMLASHFDKVTAIDVSKEALRAAADHNRAEKNVRFVHKDLRQLSLGDQYNVIVCAEVLYYIREKDAQLVCRQLDRHLAANGIILMVTGIKSGPPDFFYSGGWEEVLAAYFERTFKEIVQEPSRPYQILVFSRRN